jgi:hypothetical protein
MLFCQSDSKTRYSSSINSLLKYLEYLFHILKWVKITLSFFFQTGGYANCGVLSCPDNNNNDPAKTNKKYVKYAINDV